MAQHVHGDAFHVVRRDIGAAGEEGVGAAGEREIDGGARRGAHADERRDVDAVVVGTAGRVDQADDVALHLFIQIEAVHHGARLLDGVETDDRLRHRHFLGGACQIEHEELLFLGRIVHDHLHHEAVELGLGERIGAFLLQRVLRGQHEERRRQHEGLLADGDLLFLHRLKQGALHLGGSAVDFVGEDEVREHRPVFHAEARFPRVVDFRAHDVGGQHVRGELDAVELRVHQRGERLERQRFRQSGHAFEQDVALDHQGNEQAVHQVALADEVAADFRAKRLDPVRGLAHDGFRIRRAGERRGVFFRVKCHGSVSLILKGSMGAKTARMPSGAMPRARLKSVALTSTRRTLSGGSSASKRQLQLPDPDQAGHPAKMFTLSFRLENRAAFPNSGHELAIASPSATAETL